ncbi:hypothetical protein EDC04DRAFT_1469708 [Pisolithus marmoratus]|nr:hypothetical protein EDC04DRAFT_1469708 [Pisolithus marmoratus]
MVGQPCGFSVLYLPLPLSCAAGMSAQYAPEKLAKSALDYGINLDIRVDRDNTFRPLHGGMAVVYRGTLRPQGTTVAIKCLRFYPHGDEPNIDHIVREIDSWRKLQHENLVPVFGVVTKFDFAVSIVSEWTGKWQRIRLRPKRRCRPASSSVGYSTWIAVPS